jgi:hypothetical protein
MSDIDDRIAAAAPVEVLPREDLVRECRRLREENERLTWKVLSLEAKCDEVLRYKAECERQLSAKCDEIGALMVMLNAERARVSEARGCIKTLVRCAVPNAVDHPTMWNAWGDASQWLGEDRNAHRIPHVHLQGPARAKR